MYRKARPLLGLMLLAAIACATNAAHAMTESQAKALCAQSHNGSLAALAELTAAAQKGQPAAENWLGVYYGAKHDYKAALPWTRKAARQGDSLAEYVLGGAYYYGDGVARSDSKAAYWYRLAVDQGYQGARGMLRVAEQKLAHPAARSSSAKPTAPGDTTENVNTNVSTHVPLPGHAPALPAPSRAVTHPTPPTPANSISLTPSAENRLGYAYYSGQGKTRNYPKAVYWFRKAARQGDVSAENNLGVAYNHGHGVPRNYHKAIYWYRRAAEQKNPSAETNLGVAYYEGNGVKNSTLNALHWWKQAASQGDRRAQSYLSVVQMSTR